MVDKPEMTWTKERLVEALYRERARIQMLESELYKATKTQQTTQPTNS